MRCAVAMMAAVIALGAGGTASAGFFNRYPRVTGNDTGGIIPYSPAIEPIYRDMAADHCARWGRLSHITSIKRRYGEYVSFVCIDKPWVIH
jgi:hypothetical protein